jgi:PHD/YefM family antitoxin component YafN of YafNO toxin-antitoxin module
MKQHLQYLTDENGEKRAVVVPLADYEKLLQDLDDLAVAAERRGEPVISHKKLVAELKRDGIL